MYNNIFLFINLIIISILEGITENLPVSSTGHMILISKFLNINYNNIKNFLVFIHFSSLISTIFFFLENNLLNSNLIYNCLFGLIPVLLVGLLIMDILKITYNKIIILVLFFISFSLIMINYKLIDFFNYYLYNEKKFYLNYKRSFLIGIFTCLSFLPGISRLASTIIGGLLLNIEYKQLINFAFFLNVPIIICACIKRFYDIIKLEYINYNTDNNILFFIYTKFLNNINYILLIIICNIISYFLNKIFINYCYNFMLNKTSLLYIGIYRIILSLIILLLYFKNIIT